MRASLLQYRPSQGALLESGKVLKMLRRLTETRPLHPSGPGRSLRLPRLLLQLRTAMPRTERPVRHPHLYLFAQDGSVYRLYRMYRRVKVQMKEATLVLAPGVTRVNLVEEEVVSDSDP
jgi:hypothetical protein